MPKPFRCCKLTWEKREWDRLISGDGLSEARRSIVEERSISIVASDRVVCRPRARSAIVSSVKEREGLITSHKHSTAERVLRTITLHCLAATAANCGMPPKDLRGRLTPTHTWHDIRLSLKQAAREVISKLDSWSLIRSFDFEISSSIGNRMLSFTACQSGKGLEGRGVGLDRASTSDPEFCYVQFSPTEALEYRVLFFLATKCTCI
jgi:hypothetical protein